MAGQRSLDFLAVTGPRPGRRHYASIVERPAGLARLGSDTSLLALEQKCAILAPMCAASTRQDARRGVTGGSTTLRLILFADTHLGFDLPQHQRISRRRRGDDFAANYRRVLDHALRTRPAALVHAGDVFFRSRVAPEVVNDAFLALSEVAESGIPVAIAPGNHDRSRLPPSVWLGHPNIHVFDRPRTVRFEAQGLRVAIGGFPFARGDIRVSFLHHLANTGLERTDADVRLLCMHQTVAGASVGPDGFTFRSGPQVIPPALLPASLTAVLAGHIHRAQVLRTAAGPAVFYPGSTERTSFAERNEAKGFFDLTIATEHGRPEVVEAGFIALPTRPMVDLRLPQGLHQDDLGDVLPRGIAQLPGDAVVRITSDGPPTPALARTLNASFLRSCFPASMNVQLSRELIDASR